MADPLYNNLATAISLQLHGHTWEWILAHQETGELRAMRGRVTALMNVIWPIIEYERSRGGV